MRPSDPPAAPPPDGPPAAGAEGPRENVLGRVTDPAALDAESGSIASLDLHVPGTWAGRRVRIAVPRRFPCGRCGGGGCDRCGRSGAFVVRGPGYRGQGEASREVSFEMQLPPVIAVKPVLVRLPRPFGEDAGVDQLHVVIDDGPPDPRVTFVDGLAPPPPASSRTWAVLGVLLVLALVLALRLLG